jgi:MFS transporter, DHA1 family, multidrug resistance protein
MPPQTTIASPIRLAALLALLAMFGPFTIDAFFPAFHAVERDLNASAFTMQQTISVYLLAYALMSLFHGPLSDAYGRRLVILFGVIAYVFASIGCALAQTIDQLLTFRALQGMSTGAGLIVGRAIVCDLYQGPEAQKVMSMITLFFGIAPALAPLVGGVVYQLMGWHAVFWFLAVYGVALWILCVRVLPETHPQSARTSFRPQPLFEIYRRISTDWRFVLLVICTGFNFGAFFLYISSAPAFVEHILGLGTLGYPWFFAPAIGGMMAGAAISNRLAGRVAPRAAIRVGYTIMGAALVLNLLYNALIDNPTAPWAVLPVSLHALGNALCFPVLSIKMLDRYPNNRGAASSVQGFLWGLMTGAVAAFLSPLLSLSASHLAWGAGVLMVLGYLSWRWYVAITPLVVDEEPQALVEEPMEPV